MSAYIYAVVLSDTLASAALQGAFPMLLAAVVGVVALAAIVVIAVLSMFHRRVPYVRAGKFELSFDERDEEKR